MKYLIFSTKRSTHHDFLESVLPKEKYFYENNLEVRVDKKSNDKNKKVLLPAVVSGEKRHEESCYVASFEMNYSFPSVLNVKEFHEKFPDVKKFSKVIFLRDPLNTLASTISVHNRRVSQGVNQPFSWVERNARLWCDLASYSNDVREGGDFYFIYANRFWRDDEYSSDVVEKLGLVNNKIDHLSTFANGGNSFFPKDKMSHSDRERRYLDYYNDDSFSDVVKNNYKCFEQFLLRYDEVEMLEFIQRLK